MNIGEKIKKARRAKGMTQEELGELLGVKKSAVAKYENGRVVNIKRSTIKKMSNILGLSPADFIFEKPTKKETATDEISLTDDEVKLVCLFRKLPLEKQNEIIEKLKSYTMLQN